MTDKKIIDGIDVSECQYLQYKGCNFAQCLIKMASFDLKCEGYNCQYKQLKHKEQKLEKIKDTCNTYQMEYMVNNGVYLLTTKIVQIIEGE